MTTSTKWQAFFASHLANNPAPAAVKRQAPNPRPAGVIRPVSATQAALAVFKANPGQFFSRWALIRSTGCTAKSIDWACRYLIAQGLIEAASCDPRNPRFHQYRLVERQTHAAKTSSPCAETSQHRVSREGALACQSEYQKDCVPRRAGVSAELAQAALLPGVSEKQDAMVESHELVEPQEPDVPLVAEQLQPESANAPVELISVLLGGCSACAEADDTFVFADESRDF